MPQRPHVQVDYSRDGAAPVVFNETRGVYTIKSPTEGNLTIPAYSFILLDTRVSIIVDVGFRADFIPDVSITGLTSSIVQGNSFTSGSNQFIIVKVFNASPTPQTVAYNEFIGYLTISPVVEPVTTYLT